MLELFEKTSFTKIKIPPHLNGPAPTFCTYFDQRLSVKPALRDQRHGGKVLMFFCTFRVLSVKFPYLG
jgi:hypothetical protein